jgi:hypothetical protein
MRTSVVLISAVVLIFISNSSLAADAPCRTIKLPKLHKVSLGLQGVDIRHVLYHEQGFHAARQGQIQLEVVDMRANHADGSLWFWGGASARCLLRYDPATGKTEVHPLPRSANGEHKLASHLYLLVKRGKVYMVDLRDPCSHVAIYDVNQRRLSFAPLLSGRPEGKMGIVTGNAPKTGPYLYYFIGADAAETSANHNGLIRWDTRTARGKFIAYPYDGPDPIFGVESSDGASIWSPIWNGNALARFDVRSSQWNGYWKTPFEKETQPTSAGTLGNRFYCVDLFRPRLLPFATKTKKWLPPIFVPGHGQIFGVLGGGWIYQDKIFCSMATLKGYIPHGGPIGVDGKPWHFLDRHLCYDPNTETFTHQVLKGTETEYWMNSVSVLQGQHMYFVAINLRQPDNTIDQFGRGEVAIFQTHPRGQPEREPVLNVIGEIIK